MGLQKEKAQAGGEKRRKRQRIFYWQKSRRTKFVQNDDGSKLGRKMLEQIHYIIHKSRVPKVTRSDLGKS